MKIIDLLNELRGSIPLIQNASDESFLAFLEKYFKQVCLQLEKVEQEQLEEIAASFNWSKEQLCHNFDYLTRKIVKSIKMFYDGKPASAYNCLKKNVLTVKLDGSDERYIDYFSTFGLITPSFYRIRKKDKDNKIFSVDDLYHKPFHQRTEIKPQRFSILGHPTLYLSTSIYTCWVEMGQPNLNDFYISKYNLTEPIFFADLSTPTVFEDISIKENTQKAFRFLISFPLIAATLTKVKNINDPFKPEYVVPQLILQFIRNDKMIDGIMYTSTKISDQKNNDAWNYRNVVIPVLSNKESGYCEKLRKKFNITMPVLVEDNPLLIPIINVFNDIEQKMNVSKK